MRGPCVGFTWALALSAANVAFAAPPAAPQVTMGAELKLLRFDWEPVAGATFYRLWIKPGGSRYISVGERIPASVTQAEHAIPVHLQNWLSTRYVVTACNSSGCSHSAALNPRSVMLDAIGYLKASNTDEHDSFGGSVALSDDGYTLAVCAGAEDSNASGVNGDQTDNSSGNSGAVYVFRRRGNTWQQEAYLKASVNQRNQNLCIFERGVALSADGSILVAGADGEDVNGVLGVGAVYIYRRAGNVWRFTTRLDSPQRQRFDGFGIEPDISDDGSVLKVMSFGSQNENGQVQYSAHTYLRTGNSWQHFYTLGPLDNVERCPVARLSGDGQTLVRRCNLSLTEASVITMKRTADTWVRTSELPDDGFGGQLALNSDATVMALWEFSITGGTVVIYRWVGGTWVRETGFAAPAQAGHWGSQLALGDNGRLLAIGDPVARELGVGVSPVERPGTEDRGAVYLYQRNDATNTWALRNVVKSPNSGELDAFGLAISLSASGRTLAVGAPGEDSAATGIDGDREDESAALAGAAYLY